MFVMSWLIIGSTLAMFIVFKILEEPRRGPSRFHQALYADSIRKRIAAGEITKEDGLREMELIMGYRR